MSNDYINLKDKYFKEVIPVMKERFGYKSDLAVPRIIKVVINTGIGRFRENKELVEKLEKDLAAIAGQKPAITQAKKSVAAFKIRKGLKVGYKITLRGQRMYDFLDKLINIALPRSRDFRGLSEKSIDKNGNLTIGIKEHIIFPEISAEEAKHIFGLEVCIVLSNVKERKEAIEFFKLLGFPFRK